MYKNIIFIHLESINNLTFKMQAQLFPNLYKIATEGLYYQNYYSSATSTHMVITDLMCGNMYRNESSINNKNGYKETYHTETIFDYLKRVYGYHTGMIILPDMYEQKKMVSRKIIGENVESILLNDYKDFKYAITEFIQSSEPFALFIGNFITHIEYQRYSRERNGNALSRWQDTRKMLDELCGEVMEWLKQRIDNTLLVFYGDHGDDFWGHKLNNGYIHAIEPYTNMINTPLIMYIPHYGGKHICNELISTIDIKDIVLNLLKRDTNDVSDICNRKYIFSRNLYAGQKMKSLLLEKGYAVSDEEYLLLVTSRGLELYNNVLDPQDSCNILEFYNMDKDGNIAFNLSFERLKSSHFPFFFRKLEINNVINHYLILRQELLEEVCKIYRSAHIHKKSIFRELAFNKINNIHGYQTHSSKIKNWIVDK